jgi:hypothetical protein
MKFLRLLVYGSILMRMVLPLPSSAQNYTGDARLVAMGGVGGHANAARRMAGDTRSYRSIGIPIGLFQVLKNTKVFDPDESEFNPLRGVTLLTTPLHYTTGLGQDEPGDVLVRDIVNGRLSRDLNTYRGFAPRPQFDALGLVSPSFGYTARLHGEKDSPFQGIYVGAGPYLSLGTDARFDPRLIELLTSSSNAYVPNASFRIDDRSDGQIAGALTVGYRGRFALPRSGLSGGDHDGVYVLANYNYLRGFRRDDAVIGVRFDTDAQGLLTINPTTTPVVIEHGWSTKGNGLAVDLGSAVVMDRWEFNVAAIGIANRIDWKERRQEVLTLSTLLQGSAFTRTRVGGPSEERVELPVQYLAGGSYSADRWTAASEISHGTADWEFRGGAEYRMTVVEFRSGTLYRNKDWQPTAGAGINFTPRFAIDGAVYATSTNIERKRKAAFALSLRFNRNGH